MSDRDPGFHGLPDPDRPGDANDAEQVDAHLEEELRRLLHEAVRPLQPSPDALAHLQAAVPARRRRRRQLLAATAASVVMLGVGTPLAVLTATTNGGADDSSVEAGPGADRGGHGTGGAGDLAGTSSAGPDGASPAPRDGEDGGSGDPDGGENPTEGETDSGGEESAPAATTACARSQLGDAQIVTDEPDAAGQIRGAFRVANVSDTPCLVQGSGELTALPFGGVRTADVQVLDRSTGDQPSALPQADEAVPELVLAPGASYEVQFAYVPADDEPDGGCEQADPTGDPSTDPTGGTDPDAGEAAGGSGGAAPGQDQGGEAAGGNGSGETSTGNGGGPGDSGGDPGADAGVVLRYTPPAGGPEAGEVSLLGVCSGVIYHTGVLQAPAG